MPKSTPQNLARTFKDRTIGIFRKASKLHAIDDSIRISIIIEKPGQLPFVYTTEDQGFAWPSFMQQYMESEQPIVKRPSHFVTLNEGISRGRVRVVRQLSYSPSSSPRPHTPEGFRMMDRREFDDDEDGVAIWQFPTSSTPQTSPSRHHSPLPPRKSIVLPSKRRRLESNTDRLEG